MQVRVGISKRHVHLTQATYLELFGNDLIKVRNPLLQPGQFTATEVVDTKNGDKRLERLRIVGPFREYNQVEISKSDANILGVNPPVRNSGDLRGAGTITLVGPKGEVTINNALIIAKKHCHLSWEEAKTLNLVDNQEVTFKTKVKPLVVVIKCSQAATTEIHVDSDESEEYNLQTGDILERQL